MRKALFAIFGVAMLVLAGAATAGNLPSNDMLKVFTGGAGTIAWTAEGGSSTTGDNQALKLSGTTQGADWSGAYAINATSPGVLLSVGGCPARRGISAAVR